MAIGISPHSFCAVRCIRLRSCSSLAPAMPMPMETGAGQIAAICEKSVPRSRSVSKRTLPGPNSALRNGLSCGSQTSATVRVAPPSIPRYSCCNFTVQEEYSNLTRERRIVFRRGTNKAWADLGGAFKEFPYSRQDDLDVEFQI